MQNIQRKPQQYTGNFLHIISNSSNWNNAQYKIFYHFNLCRHTPCQENNLSFNAHAATLSPSSGQWGDSTQSHPIQSQAAQNMQISYSNHTVRRTSLVT